MYGSPGRMDSSRCAGPNKVGFSARFRSPDPNDDRDYRIDLDERITEKIGIVVLLYADDGDGRLDGATDRVVSDDDYEDTDDLEAEESHLPIHWLMASALPAGRIPPRPPRIRSARVRIVGSLVVFVAVALGISITASYFIAVRPSRPTH